MTNRISCKLYVLGASSLFFAVLAVPSAFAVLSEPSDPGTQLTSVEFRPAVTFGSGGYIAQGVAIADLNGDGRPDIVVSNWYNPNSLRGVVGVLLRNSRGGFGPVVTYRTGGSPNWAVSVADVNGDGKPDLIVSSCAPSDSTCGSADGVVSVLLGNGNGTFQPAGSYDTGALHADLLSVADVNGDGNMDILVTNEYGGSNGDGTVAVLLGNGNGTFQPAVLYDSGAQDANGVTAADVNGDGVLDLLVANRCVSCSGGVLGVLLGNGNGTFQPAVTYATGGGNACWASVKDLNGDGIPDVVVANENLGFAEGTIAVLLGTGNGTFGAPVTFGSGGYAAVELVAADFNGDGRTDIAVANCGPVGGCGTGTVGVLLGQGNGSFDPVVTFSSGAYNATAIAAGDLNGDGLPDVVTANQCEPASCTLGSVGVLINNTKR